MYTDIRTEKRGACHWIVLNRPDAMNAVRPKTYVELTHAFEDADADRDTRFIVLSGEGRGFCAGDDFNEIFLSEDQHPSKRSDATLARYRSRHGAATPVVGAILACTKPTIAAINGPAVGIGLELATACDIRYASDKAKLGEVAVPAGFVPESGGARNLPKFVGLGRAMEMIMTGEIVDAAEAERIGLVAGLCEPEALLARALACARQILAHSPYSTLHTKRVMWNNLDAPSLGAALDLENHVQVLALMTEDFGEAALAFSQKRAPQWRRR